MSASFSWFFLSGFPTKTLYNPLLSLISASHSAHLIGLYLIKKNIGLGEQTIKLLIM